MNSDVRYFPKCLYECVCVCVYVSECEHVWFTACVVSQHTVLNH